VLLACSLGQHQPTGDRFPTLRSQDLAPELEYGKVRLLQQGFRVGPGMCVPAMILQSEVARFALRLKGVRTLIMSYA
jgi:hypothetical protein